MDIKQAFALTLKTVRKDRGLTQEDFSETSSRTYISTLERGKKSITLEKMDQLALTLKIHPLTLVALTYSNIDPNNSLEKLLKTVESEIINITQIKFTPE